MPTSQQLAASLWSLAVGIGFVAVIWVTIASGWFRKGTEEPVVTAPEVFPEPVEPIHHYPEGLAEAHGKVPMIIKAIVVGYLVFLVGYTWLFLDAWNGSLSTIDAFLTK